jgi:hypothetical protein
MTLHMAWTITGTVNDIYSPGAITAAADGVRHLPVVVAGELIGMVSARICLPDPGDDR